MKLIFTAKQTEVNMDNFEMVRVLDNVMDTLSLSNGCGALSGGGGGMSSKVVVIHGVVLILPWISE
eukprot:scaffold34965_cov76-Cyclotella_meneghiniana.AAC.13